MQLPDDLLEKLKIEFRFAADRIKEEEEPFRKMYFFSAFYGEAQRVLNFAWDRELALIHHVTQATYREIQSRFDAIAVGRDRAVQTPRILLDVLAEVTDDLAKYVAGEADSQALCDLLGRFAELGYVTTGNGQYLYEKGVLKLSLTDSSTEPEQPSSQ